jgi:hypothetical protein
MFECGIDYVADGRGVFYVERCQPELFPILRLEPVKLVEFAGCTRDSVAALQK